MLKRLIALDKPFIIIVNSLSIFSKYFKEIFKDKEIYFITPSKKIHYDKYKDGHLLPPVNKTSFYSIFVTFKLLKKNIFV
jgi:hypothetical protein